MLANFGSRKLWITILTMLAVLLGASKADGVDPSQVTVIATTALGGIYVAIQGWVDAVKERATAVATRAAVSDDMLSRFIEMISHVVSMTSPAANPTANAATPASSYPEDV